MVVCSTSTVGRGDHPSGVLDKVLEQAVMVETRKSRRTHTDGFRQRVSSPTPVVKTQVTGKQLTRWARWRTGKAVEPDELSV